MLARLSEFVLEEISFTGGTSGASASRKRVSEVIALPLSIKIARRDRDLDSPT